MSNKGLQPVSSDYGGTLYEGDFVATKVDKSKIGTISEQLHLERLKGSDVGYSCNQECRRSEIWILRSQDFQISSESRGCQESRSIAIKFANR